MVPGAERRAAPRQGFLKPAEYSRLAAACEAVGAWLRLMFELAYVYGWRRREILGLKVGGCNFDDGTISIPDSKSGEPRCVPMTAKVRELLRAACKGKFRSQHVVTRDGVPVVDFREAWARALEAADVDPSLLLHDLRRTACRNMRDRGTPQSIRMAIMGPKTTSMEQRYNIVDLEDMRREMAKADAMPEEETMPEKTAATGIVRGIVK